MNILLLPKQAANEQCYVITNKEQVTHILKVLKLAVGETIKIGCQQGKLGFATIADINKQQGSITLKDINCTQLAPAKLDLTVILALPRPRVLRRLIIDMTAIGVRDIILLGSNRTEKSYWQSPILERLDDFVTEGLQQGVDTIAPHIVLQKRFKPFVEDELSVLTQSQSAVVAHPRTGDSFNTHVAKNGLPQIVCIGAEGGWIDYEIELFTANGCQVVNMGQRILRTEAAVNALGGRYL